jgi:hypothetical protein
VFLTGCAKHQWTEIAEETVGRLYNDLVKNFGRVAHEELSGADILRLMQQRYEAFPEGVHDCFQSPSDLTTAVIVSASLMLLDEAVDQSLMRPVRGWR